MTIDKVLAGIALTLCLGMLLRMGLRERHRQRMDALAHRIALAGRRGARKLWFWRTHRRHALREAEEAIRRAQRTGKRDGNVVRPDAFNDPRKPR